MSKDKTQNFRCSFCHKELENCTKEGLCAELQAQRNAMPDGKEFDFTDFLLMCDDCHERAQKEGPLIAQLGETIKLDNSR